MDNTLHLHLPPSPKQIWYPGLPKPLATVVGRIRAPRGKAKENTAPCQRVLAEARQIACELRWCDGEVAVVLLSQQTGDLVGVEHSTKWWHGKGAKFPVLNN